MLLIGKKKIEKDFGYLFHLIVTFNQADWLHFFFVLLKKHRIFMEHTAHYYKYVYVYIMYISNKNRSEDESSETAMAQLSLIGI